MRKSRLSNGIPFYGIKIEHFVSKDVFARAIGGHCYEENTSFDPNTPKKEAIRILKVQLFRHGIEGLYTEHWDGASEEFWAPFNNGYQVALVWIDKNFPYLSIE